DVVALVEIQRQPDHLVGGEARAPHVAGHAVDAVHAVEDAEVGQQDLQQRHAAPVRRVRVADAHATGAADATGLRRVPLGRAAGGARRVVLGRVGQYREFFGDVHRARVAGTGLSR